MSAHDIVNTNAGNEASAARRRPRTTMPFRVELARQLSQWRVRIVLLILVLIPVIVRIALLIGGPPTTSSNSNSATTLVALAQVSGGTFAAFVLQLTQGFLVTLIAALLYGDMIAGEASRSTLKYLLTIPVPRMRLLAVKVAVASTLLLAGLAALTVVALVVGVFSYGPGGIQVPGGPELALGDSIGRLALSTATGASGLLWAAGLGTLLTVVANSPLAAAGGVVLASILSRLLDSIPTLGDLRIVLPTHYSTAFAQFLTAPTDLAPVADSVLSGLIWAVVLGTLAAWWFSRKDISG
ncbi:ABC transporter permease subunit [Subtercola endophyticus]|uniref:ABC transporter permease subunit n=1 Tax=Subtercola endophyticus TaxID=2895559 RepID=UPI001E2A75D6|nr:ABC transporter permease subunit [Subtercola endophyticus]UFS58622.1 ABC transporter permease [Subtercola endophyticus]